MKSNTSTRKSRALYNALQHGHCRNRVLSGTYRSWQNMFRRCCNPSYHAYAHYGGRGIKVCKRWSKFANFLKDMGERPKGMTLERKNTNGHYSKSNCKWIPASEQCSNKRNNRVLKIGRKCMTLAQASRRFGVARETIARRLNVGYSDRMAVLPVGKLKRALAEVR